MVKEVIQLFCFVLGSGFVAVELFRAVVYLVMYKTATAGHQLLHILPEISTRGPSSPGLCCNHYHGRYRYLFRCLNSKPWYKSC